MRINGQLLETETNESALAASFTGQLARYSNHFAKAPDCGLKYLPRDIAFAKMAAMAEGARIVRAELANP